MGGPKSHHIHWILFHGWHCIVDGAARSERRGEGVCVSLGWLLPLYGNSHSANFHVHCMYTAHIHTLASFLSFLSLHF